MARKSDFDRRLTKIPGEIWQQIAGIDELKGRWIGGVTLAPQVLARLKQSVLVTSTGASTRIEGARLADEDVEKLMRGIDIQKFASRDKQEVRGYFELLKNVFNSWKSLRLTESTIKHFHKELLKYVEKDVRHRGEYKKTENKVVMVDNLGKVRRVLFDTTPVYLTPKEMQELVEWTQKALSEGKYHPLIIIGNFLVEFLSIHPFSDGNGRLSRILTNLLLLKAGYGYMPYVSHEKLIEDNKPDYYLALRWSQRTFNTDHEDITAWMRFFLAVVVKQAKMAVALLTEENVERILSAKQLAVWQYLQTGDEAAAGKIAEKTKIPRPTVNQALQKLLRLKRIEQIGMGRGVRYRVAKLGK